MSVTTVLGKRDEDLAAEARQKTYSAGQEAFSKTSAAIAAPNKYRNEAKRVVRGISGEAENMLLNYDWPGNVRELQAARN